MITEKEIASILDGDEHSNDALDVSIFEPHTSLHPKIWDDDHLSEGIRNKLYRIALEFYLFLNVQAPVKDITVTGSLANYNYTKNSDIDLHILIDYHEVDENIELVEELLSSKKTVWNDRHNITIFGHEVELYAQNLNEPHHSTGVYSIIKNEWVTKPKPMSAQIDFAAVRAKSQDLMHQIDKVSSENELAIDALKTKIRKMRQCGLETAGEYSVENLAFKVLRNTGHIGKLYTAARKMFDDRLSLEETNESRLRALVKWYVNSGVNTGNGL